VRDKNRRLAPGGEDDACFGPMSIAMELFFFFSRLALVISYPGEEGSKYFPYFT
jgi:hypothetical protein